MMSGDCVSSTGCVIVAMSLVRWSLSGGLSPVGCRETAAAA